MLDEIDDLAAGEEFGPAMRVLNERQRAFVRAVLRYPTATGGRLAKLAGFKNSEVGHRVTAHRLLHNDKVLAAIQEETWKQIKLGGLVGVAQLVKMANDTKHPQHFRACEALADRAGFSAALKVDVNVDDKRPRTDAEKRASIVRLAAELGYPVEKMLGGNAVPAIAGPGPVIEHDG